MRVKIMFINIYHIKYSIWGKAYILICIYLIKLSSYVTENIKNKRNINSTFEYVLLVSVVINICIIFLNSSTICDKSWCLISILINKWLILWKYIYILF